MKTNKWFILWIVALLAVAVLGGLLIYTGLTDYVNGVRLPHHSEKLAQGIRSMLC